MTSLDLRTCALNLRGIPDLSDLDDVTIDTDLIVGASFHLAIDLANPEHPWYYPFAALEYGRELLLIPLDSERRPDAAEHALNLLRDAFGGERA